MARQPEDRYASAQLLAADIEKWLGQEPISVYREPWTQRVGRRMRRHRTLVTAIGVALLVAILIMGVGSIWLNEAQRNEMAAKKRAQTLADEASAKYKLARKAVDDMLTGVGEKLRTPQDLPAVRRELLQQALEFNRQFLVEKSDDPEVHARPPARSGGPPAFIACSAKASKPSRNISNPFACGRPWSIATARPRTAISAAISSFNSATCTTIRFVTLRRKSISGFPG